MRMTDYLQREGLWDLTTEEEDMVERPDEVKEIAYEKKMEKYLAQRWRIQKAIGTPRLAMTDAIAVNYYNASWDRLSRIWEDVTSNYETAITYDSNHLQKEL
jgi:hypothetical protein